MEFKFNKDANEDFLIDKKIAIVVGYFYQEIGDKLLAGAYHILEKYGIDKTNVNVFYAPGAFEIPLLTKKLAKSGSYDGIVTLGAVINGETPHFDFVCNECARGVADVSYQYEVPTAFGVLTTSNMEQTIGRAGGYKGNKGEEAAMAMVEMLYLLDKTH
ncbi:6,7-dimethyl-8-ribityllumazine synthase (EC 2.5.1.78) [uncultured Gammaproteobacteria bacterium]|jgi:6,7-dimethyl-8-ribityllumazine synthase|nr:6,7-dimethyl-8-ribityllumazine synthase (EC [Bathymodiolus brooksi thiotrophic gill symbiont]CAC9563070.1 6,7-dimethyl-8-ribityllumazine synthase (EC 2.5.1.78) [uncultured Gammaproteobacteria bacterium]CAB9542231.1 6,7-dimethyl-8-ribityllumazine synthase (EC [Bathymodiolus brooksi thiotrophic gill symbiont]CAC9577040.1 6,7-dimethyl-8-ribityllumazine synthase (EC 2.5.1.78) [uncultured Gammaproteobacteria bacterium]CAC9599803.1 6,7-dimethyl-8-ribityllumazine synthase (EC 2.5.1.78) [uncultured 